MRALLLSIVAALVVAARPASAHPTPFSYLDVRVNPGAASVDLVAHIIDIAHDLNIEPPETLFEPATLRDRGDEIAALLASRFQLRADGAVLRAGPWSRPEPVPERQSLRISSRFALERVPGTLQLEARMFPYDPLHQTFINVYEGDTLALQAILDASKTTVEFFSGSRQGVSAVIRRFVPAGIRHILIGPDHLLFLVGLLLLVSMMWLVDSVVPRFWGLMRDTVAQDAAAVFVSAVERGEALDAGELTIYADAVQVEPAPADTGAVQRLRLSGVAALQRSRDGVVGTEFLAEQAMVDVHRRDGATVMKLSMLNGTGFRAGDGTVAFIPHASPDAVEIGRATERDARSTTTDELRTVRESLDGEIAVQGAMERPVTGWGQENWWDAPQVQPAVVTQIEAPVQAAARAEADTKSASAGVLGALFGMLSLRRRRRDEEGTV
mgnify:CR=1 FL=1